MEERRGFGDMRQITLEELARDPKEPTALAPVKYELVQNVTPAKQLEQMRFNMNRGLPEIPVVGPKPIGEDIASLCGSAPSLVHHLHELKGSVMAVNGAIGKLVEWGEKVHYPMIWDSSLDMVRHACVAHGATWMLASKVHPWLIDKLEAMGQKIMLWHTASTEPEVLGLQMNKQVVFGGPTGATRGPFLLGALGYRDFHIFGADSSFAEDAVTHHGGSSMEEEEILVLFEDQYYRTTPWMNNQAETWVTFVLPELVTEGPDGATFTVYGDGLLPAAHRSWLRQALPTLSPEIQQRFRRYQ